MSKNEKPESQFKNILEMLNSYPLWVKETMFLYLRDELKNVKDLNDINNLSSKDSLFLYEPKLARFGQSFLDNLKSQEAPVDIRLVNFIKSVKKQKNLIDIAQDNDWTLKIACYYVLKAWEKNIILPTYSKTVYALVRFLAGDISLGEYLVRMGRLNKEQLTWVMKMNQTGMMESFEEKSNEEEVFLNLGYISVNELNNLRDLIKISDDKNIVKDPTTALVSKIRDLQKTVFQLEDVNNNLVEDKRELEKKVEKVSAELTFQKKENVQYYKEIEILKSELKKALKG